MKINYIPLHIGDFLGGVVSMDATEVGAYTMLLLAHYQAGECGLPNDDKKLARIAKASPRQWARIKDNILIKFTLKDSFWVHSTVVEELQKIQSKSSKATANALKRWDKHMPTHKTSNADAILTNNHEPITNNQIDTKVSIVKEKFSMEKIYNFEGCQYQPEQLFEIFWNAYPSVSAKGPRKEAMTKFIKLLKSGENHEEIINGVRKYAKFCKDENRYNKNATTYLHPKNRNWEEEWEHGTGSQNIGDAGIIAEGMRRALFDDGEQE